MADNERDPEGGSAGRAARSPAARGFVVTTTDTELTAEEERLLRARHGLPVPEDAPLPQKGDGLPESVRAQLRRIEEQAFARAGRREALLAETDAELDELDQLDARRHKIIDRLRSVDED